MFSNQITVSLSTQNIYNRDQVSKAARLGFNTQSVINAKDVRQFEIGLDKYWNTKMENLSTKPASKTRKTPETTPK